MKKKKQAFTLVELMLAVAFLGTLLLSIAMLTMQLINIYTKGATMRAINSLGSTMMRDIRSAIGASDSMPENLDISESSYLYRNDMTKDANSKFGMFCTGSYTYVWNYQSAMLEYRDYISTGGGSSSSYINIFNATTGENRPYAFARIKDANCSEFNEVVSGSKNAPSTKTDDLTVLLDGATSGDGTDLALYDFSVLTATRSKTNGKALYTISFVLGTTRGGIDVSSTSNYCKLNSSTTTTTTQQNMSDVSMDYCSVNRFEFTVRQTGSKSGIGV